MIVTKSLKIPIHYAVTKAKLDKLNKLTARITFGIRLTSSFILCHCCKLKYDADLNAAHNIALRCIDDWLKVQMTSVENRASA